MKPPIDFLMIYPHRDLQAYSQRLLLGILKSEGLSVHLLVVPDVSGIQNNPEIRRKFLELVGRSRVIGFGFMSDAYDRASYLTKLIKNEFSKPVIIKLIKIL